MSGLKYFTLVCLLMCLHTATAYQAAVTTCRTGDGYGGHCVRHYQCNADGFINVEGAGIFTTKIGSCEDKGDELYKCCRLRNNIQTTPLGRRSLKCGFRNRNGVGSKTLASGVQGPTLLGELPWSVALFSTDQEQDLQDDNGYFCGGTLIHPSVVLSAAHCFNNRVAEEVRARVGDWNINESTERTVHQEIGVKQIISHENYVDGNKANNVALLILKQPAKLDAHIAPICLPEPDALPSPTSKCFAAGWGRDINDIYPSTISMMKMQITERAQCQEAHRNGIPNPIFKLHDSFICASSTVDRCAADGGSPLVCSTPDDSNTYIQYGILSWASGCDTGELPALYASVATLRQWIDNKLTSQNINSVYYTYNKT